MNLLTQLIAVSILTFIVFLFSNSFKSSQSVSEKLKIKSDLTTLRHYVKGYLDCSKTPLPQTECSNKEIIPTYQKDGKELTSKEGSLVTNYKIRTKCDSSDLLFEYSKSNKNEWAPLFNGIPISCFSPSQQDGKPPSKCPLGNNPTPIATLDDFRKKIPQGGSFILTSDIAFNKMDEKLIIDPNKKVYLDGKGKTLKGFTIFNEFYGCIENTNFLYNTAIIAHYTKRSPIFRNFQGELHRVNYEHSSTPFIIGFDNAGFIGKIGPNSTFEEINGISSVPSYCKGCLNYNNSYAVLAATVQTPFTLLNSSFNIQTGVVTKERKLSIIEIIKSNADNKPSHIKNVTFQYDVNSSIGIDNNISGIAFRSESPLKLEGINGKIINHAHLISGEISGLIDEVHSPLEIKNTQLFFEGNFRFANYFALARSINKFSIENITINVNHKDYIRSRFSGLFDSIKNADHSIIKKSNINLILKTSGSSEIAGVVKQIDGVNNFTIEDLNIDILLLTSSVSAAPNSVAGIATETKSTNSLHVKNTKVKISSICNGVGCALLNKFTYAVSAGGLFGILHGNDALIENNEIQTNFEITTPSGLGNTGGLIATARGDNLKLINNKVIGNIFGKKYTGSLVGEIIGNNYSIDSSNVITGTIKDTNQNLAGQRIGKPHTL